MDKVWRFRGLALLRSLALLIPVLVLGVTEPALAIGTAQLGPAGGCGAPAGSAINQYCEAFPSATGAKKPHAGTPSVANDLPARVVNELAQGTPAQQRLLTIPAARRHHKRHRTVSTAGLNGPETSVWSLSLLMILRLALLALGLGGAAVERRRRRRAAQGPPAS